MFGADTVHLSQNLKTGKGRVKSDGSDTDTQGSKVDVLATDAMTQTFLSMIDGNIEDTQKAKIASDGLKAGLDPRNWGGAAVGAIAQSTNIEPESVVIAAEIMGGGALVAFAAEKMSTEPIQLSEEQRKQDGLTEKIDSDTGKSQGYFYKDGKRVANKDGFLVDKSGKKIEKGMFGRAWKGLQNKGAELISSSLNR